MKTLLIVALLFAGNVYGGEPKEVTESPYYERALRYVPERSWIYDIIPARKNLFGDDPFYIRYEFDSSCYLMHVGYRRAALTTTACG